jgi:hypothetical protein
VTTIRDIALLIRPTITRSPPQSSLSYRRSGGVARFILSARVTGPGGAALAGTTVYLQSSMHPWAGWGNSFRLTTTGSGTVSHRFALRTASMRYYRWYFPATATAVTAQTSAQKVVVK